METAAFFVVAIFLLAFGLVSKRIRTTVVTPAMVFVAFGWLVGDEVLGLVEVNIEEGFARIVMELTLVLVLFTDASRIDLDLLRRQFRWPLRMLGIGLPLTIIAGTAVAVWLLDLPLWPAAVLAVVLAPTDAALGEPLVADPSLPPRLRQTLNVESGLNDGLALPFLTVALVLAGVQTELESVGYWILFAFRQIGLGVAVGVITAVIGGSAISMAHERGWSSRAFEQLAALGLALVAFAGAELATGNGFIASFVAGMVMGNAHRTLCGPLFEFAEAEGQLFTLLTFLFFGAAAAAPAVEAASGRTVLYVILSLTLIRMVPIAISLGGSGLRAGTVALLGWFGPRGVASILFGLVVLDEAEPEKAGLIFSVMALAVVVSVFAHGVSALPLARRYSQKLEGMDDQAMIEMEPVEEMPMRTRSGHHSPA